MATQETVTLVNGVLSDTISVYDRGLAYGDGVFETILSIDGRIPLWSYHKARLESSLIRLSIESIDLLAVLKDIGEHLKPDGEQIIKLIVTRGTGKRGYSIANINQPNIILFIASRSEQSKKSLTSPARVGFCNIQLAYQPQLAGMKHLNRLEQVIARKEVDELGIDEGLICGLNNEVIEATQHNLFLVRNNELYTPDLTQCGVAGVMRERIIEAAKSVGIPVNIQQLEKHSLLEADELFLTNSVSGVWPICELEDKKFPSNRVTCQFKDVINGIFGL